MHQAFFNNIIVILLTVAGIFHSPRPSLLIIAAGLLMVITTYASFETDSAADDKAEWRRQGMVMILKVLAMMSVAFASGMFAGFAVIGLLDEAKPLYRGLLSTGLYLAAELIFSYEKQSAVLIIETMLLLAIVLFLVGIKYFIDAQLRHRKADTDRLLLSNLNELHAMRLNEQLVRSSYMADKNARLTERENISRNIHNSVGHSITAAIMTLDAADMLYDVRPEDARKKMQDANERIRGSLDSIRRAVRILDEGSQFVSAADLKCEMTGIADNFMMDTDRKVQTGFQELGDEICVPHEHAEFLTGVLKELLSNGVRHGHADAFLVLLMGDERHIRLVVSDNGRSDFGEKNRDIRIQQGFGLKKMIAYADRCGGKTEFTNQNGFRAAINLPIYQMGEGDT